MVAASLVLSIIALCCCLATANGELSASRTQAPPTVLRAAEPRKLEEFCPSQWGDHEFTLRHLFHHGAHLYPNLHRRLDVYRHPQSQRTGESKSRHAAEPLHARSRPLSIQRLVDRRPARIEELLRTAREATELTSLSASAWMMDELSGPNITDKETVLSLAKMTADAYDYPPYTGGWQDVEGGFNYSNSFGWEDDGLRGHIFADETNSTIVIAIKGTSRAVFVGSGTDRNDKINDNLFFSCCCAQGGQYFWMSVCDCQSATYTCNQTCLTQALKAEDRYYRASLDLYANVTELYPNSAVWLAGHSLGGSVSSLLGLTYGLPVVTFEAPGEALPAKRLGLPSPPGSRPDSPQSRPFTGAYHFGHTADPLYLGTCNGATSVCSLGGYAMESQCHTGQECIYDVVQDKGWRVAIGTHSIHAVINDVIEAYDDVPPCKANTECVDCFNWKFFESNSSDTTTTSRTSTRSSTRTRTSTCRTPGWWGCLDESTTTTASGTPTTTTTSTSTSSTSTCKTPGWFGCRDPTTTSAADSKPSPTLTTPRATDPSTSSSTTTSTSTSCVHRGFFGGCKDSTTSTSATTPPAPTDVSKQRGSITPAVELKI